MNVIIYFSYLKDKNQKLSIKEKELIEKVAIANIESASKFDEYSKRETDITNKLKDAKERTKVAEDQMAVSYILSLQK